MNSKLLVKLATASLIAIISFWVIAPVAYADQADPDSTPTVVSQTIYRNVLETNDFFVIIYENTPYSSIPDTPYSDAFIWRFLDTDGTTELAQSLGYDITGFNGINNGYGHNVIGFYFDNATAPAWGQAYYLRLSGNPAVFDDPPQYNYSIEAADYSSLTDTDDVQTAIAAQVLNLATSLDTNWGLTADYSLLLETETSTVLSIYGESFFRGAIYGIQGLGPRAFRLIVGIIELGVRTWTDAYATSLVSQHDGTYIAPALEAGETLLSVDYNLFGILSVLIACAVIIFATWRIGGGNIWKGMGECAAILVIGARLALFGLGELGLIAAICWLYVSAKVWKII